MSGSPGQPFWDFSLAVYARPGVAEACMRLQDRRGLDVNVLLFCCWAGLGGWALTVDELAERVAAVRPWQDQVVKPLRAVRRRLKGQQTAPTQAAEALRRAIKVQELEAERLEQQILAGTVKSADGEGDAALAAANLGTYFATLDLVPGAEDRAELVALLCGLIDGLGADDALRLLG